MLKKIHPALFAGLLLAVPALAFFISLASGRYSVGLGEAISVIFRVIRKGTVLSAGDSPSERLIISVRLPRILLGLLCGCGLATAGAGLQALLANPLVSPDTLGVASGACFGAAFALLLDQGFLVVQSSALLFGILAMAITYRAGRSRNDPSIVMLVLAGMVVSALFQALVSLSNTRRIPMRSCRRLPTG